MIHLDLLKIEHYKLLILFNNFSTNLYDIKNTVFNWCILKSLVKSYKI